jgi:5-methylthioadenosine/S-adenosylhomocysteine deaminase
MPELTLPPGTTALIKGGRVLLPDGDWNQPARVDIAIAGDRIAGIAPAYASDGSLDLEAIDARESLVLPGFVNAHYHSHDVLAKGTLEEVPLETWRQSA